MTNIQVVSQYRIYKDSLIGEGQYGKIYACEDTQNLNLKLCAKIIEGQVEDPKTGREMELMQMIMEQGRNNKHIVGVHHVDMNKQRIILILERCECDLQTQFKERRKNNKYYTPVEAINILKQIIKGYKLLYDNKVIHRDIKPQNILYLDGVYKIADFGLARVYQTNDELTKAGTPKYASPQLFDQGSNFTNSADIYSLGIVCYELIFGGLPYQVGSLPQLIMKLKQLESDPIKINLSAAGMTQEIANLIENMLKYDENKRITWNNLFSHPLLKDQPSSQVTQITKTSPTPQMIQIPQFQIKPPQFVQSANPQKIDKLPQSPSLPCFQSTLEISDQLYQIATFMHFVLDSLDKHLNQQRQIHADVIKIKQQLYYLSSCFYQHSKAIKHKSQHKSNTNHSLADVERAIIQLETAKQLLVDQTINYGLSKDFPFRETLADFTGYFVQLSNLLAIQFLFPYTNKFSYYLEYLQQIIKIYLQRLLFCLTKLKELKEGKDTTIIHKYIVDIQIQLQNEIVIKQTLNSKINN
ncbi:unnamed protein product (macronuclear) [Paramecium tetraurelia]|uniref:Protein kinase domain-containing protein n=1 Tax=Paramecium tetraurelia TaxID=5888 RepID=A0C2Z5_PARTE|nr:uncharacterized protein GSPATT00034640001 [Paramecium tetraurelia]CAK65162.1 unnamed protein product [Paramecium tetraurelia]|eukprot:XP_001432559.1 hypothetical protein (macronuclear) [Paramecium tetraurelia strain d4-2]